MKHIKGPWTVDLRQTNLANIKDSVDLLIAMSLDRSNAHLIAAAPEMLESINAYFKAYDSDNIAALSAAQESMRDAVKKARGEL